MHEQSWQLWVLHDFVMCRWENIAKCVMSVWNRSMTFLLIMRSKSETQLCVSLQVYFWLIPYKEFLPAGAVGSDSWSGARAVQDMWPSVIRAVCVWLVGCGWLLLGGLFVVLFLTNPGWGAGGFMCTRFKCPQWSCFPFLLSKYVYQLWFETAFPTSINAFRCSVFHFSISKR